MTEPEDRAALTVACPFCQVAAGQPCNGWKVGGSGVIPRKRGPHPERHAAARAAIHRPRGPSAEITTADPMRLTSGEIRATLAGIRESLEKAPATGPARSNICRRIQTLEGRIA